MQDATQGVQKPLRLNNCRPRNFSFAISHHGPQLLHFASQLLQQRCIHFAASSLADGGFFHIHIDRLLDLVPISLEYTQAQWPADLPVDIGNAHSSEADRYRVRGSSLRLNVYNLRITGGLVTGHPPTATATVAASTPIAASAATVASHRREIRIGAAYWIR